MITELVLKSPSPFDWKDEVLSFVEVTNAQPDRVVVTPKQWQAYKLETMEILGPPTFKGIRCMVKYY